MPESTEDSNSNLAVLLTSSVAAAVAGLAAARSSSSSSIPSKRGLLEVLDGEHLRVIARVKRLREGHLALAAAADRVRHLVGPVVDTRYSQGGFDNSKQSIGINLNGQSMVKPIYS